jgi:murein DD-endopeptidase MepM/ murein hydrolase activator NlpD
MSQGRHAKPADTTSALKKIALAATVGLGGGVAVPVALATGASAATMEQWDRLAMCESSGNWSDGGTYSGGLQFDSSTWAAYGGTAYAPTAGQATKEEQIKVAEKLLAARGGEPWQVITQGGGDTSQGSCLGLLDKSDSVYNGGPDPFGGATPTTPSTPTTPTSPSPSGDTPAVGSKAYLAIEYAKSKINGLPYLYGGNGPDQFDCSGLTSQAWKAAGVDFTQSARDSYAQEDLPRYVSGATYQTLATMKPGDLIAYNSFSGGHVALYVGPIGPGGADLIETNSRHAGGGVGWSKRNDPSSGRPDSAITGITRPAAFVPATSGGGTTDPGGGTTTPQPSGDGTYTVKAGDTLSKIADANHVQGGWKALYELNKDVVGSNPNLIQPGMKLKLPAPADPYEYSGLPTPNHNSPSAIPLQKVLKAKGYMDKSVVENANYGPKTQAAVAAFHKANPQFSTASYDVEIGPKGWAFLLGPTQPTPEGGPGTPVPPASTGDYVRPVPGGVIQSFHNSDAGYGLGYHTGVDLQASSNTPVKAVHGGTVVSVNGAGSAYGNHVVIKHADGVYTLSAHLNSVSVSVGQTVTTGQTIGLSGSTGNSTGPHLHFELRNQPTAYAEGVFSDPIAWLKSHGVNY